MLFIVFYWANKIDWLTEMTGAGWWKQQVRISIMVQQAHPTILLTTRYIFKREGGV